MLNSVFVSNYISYYFRSTKKARKQMLGTYISIYICRIDYIIKVPINYYVEKYI